MGKPTNKEYEKIAKQISELKRDLNKVSPSCLNRLKGLLSDPRIKDIKKSHRGYRVKGRYYKGLKPVLKELFWPETEEDPFKRSKEDLKRRKTQKIHVPTAANSSKCKGYGEKHGTKVHDEVCRLVRRFASTKTVKTLPKSSDPCTIRIFELLAKKRLFPIASELAAFDNITGIVTAMDIVLIDVDESKAIAGEIKTGHEGETYGPHPTDSGMYPPLENIINCPVNRHAMQVIGTLFNFQNNYDFSFDDGIIIRACPKQRLAYEVPLPEWTRNQSLQNEVYKRLVSRKR